MFQLLESAKVLLDAGEEIPCDLLVNILKSQLQQLQAECLQRKDKDTEIVSVRSRLMTLVVEELRQVVGKKQNKTWFFALFKVEKSAEPAAKADKGKGKGKDKKGKAQTSGTETPEKKTKLKRRDEVEPPTFIGNIYVMLLHEESLFIHWRECWLSSFIAGDEPEDGPQQYILMIGFHQPQLIRALDAIDVPVENIIMLCEDKQDTLKSQSPVSEQNLEQERAEDFEDKRQKVDEGIKLAEKGQTSLHTWCGDIISFDCVRNGTPCT